MLKIEYGDTKSILSGDAKVDEEAEALAVNADLSANVYHAGHYDSRTASSDEWLKAISPEIIVISSCGDRNSYGHPHSESLEAFKSIGANINRTDEQGDTVVTSDGKTLSWNTNPSNNWNPGVEKENSIESEMIVVPEEPKEEIVPKDKTTYVLNVNTKKFHLTYSSLVSEKIVNMSIVREMK